jgi:hypothetical protein
MFSLRPLELDVTYKSRKLHPSRIIETKKFLIESKVLNKISLLQRIFYILYLEATECECREMMLYIFSFTTLYHQFF